MKIELGQEASVAKTISEFDVYNFAGVVGDYNSVHINDVKARDSMFGNRIAHGMLVAGFISSVLGTKLPGDGTVYLEQNLKFMKPVYIGDTVTATVTVSDVINKEKGIYKLCTKVYNQKLQIVIDGYAVVMYKGDFDQNEG